MNGECVITTINPHFLDSTISGNNFDCQTIDKDNSGSSNKIILLEFLDKYNFENKETICFSPEERFLNSIGSPPYSCIRLHSILNGL